MRAVAITISTSRAAGEREDESGPALRELARALGADTVESETIPDERALIEARLRHWCGEPEPLQGSCCALVLTSGGTGISRDDVTPEATRSVVEREIPGIGEAIRLASRPHTPNWMLSRATAGVRGATLIVNLPGSPRAMEQVGETLLPALAHALALIARPLDIHAGA